jgi:hypothetical protein
LLVPLRIFKQFFKILFDVFFTHPVLQ